MTDIKLNFSNKEWDISKVARTIGYVKKAAYEYTCGTIHGIYAKVPNGLDIITVDNREPHNGHFDVFIMKLEQYAQTTGKLIAICAFMNERLYWHLRRNGWGNKESTMDRLEYTPDEWTPPPEHLAPKPCLFCGELPTAKKISGVYYAQCGCAKHNPYEFIGMTAASALKQWNIGNSFTGTQGAYRRRPNGTH